MGNSVVPPPVDVRVERSIRIFALPMKKLEQLWRIFLKHDREGTGKITTDDFFEKILRFPRSRITDPMFTLIDSKAEGTINFGEFVENELKHFISNMWNNELMSNAKKCIECVDDMDDGDGTYNFKEICILYKKFPQVFFPLFDLQVHVINQTLGEYWWESHKAAMKFKKHEMEEKEFQSLRKKQQDAAKAMDLVNDDIIRARMGYVSFYLTPWNRKKERERIRRIAAIEGEIERGLHGIK